MSELGKLLEGLPIKVLSSAQVEIGGRVWNRAQVAKWTDLGYQSIDIGPLYPVGGRVILALMADCEEPTGKNPNRCAVCGRVLYKTECLRGDCSVRPLPTGEWYDPDRAVREGYPFEIAKLHGAQQQGHLPKPTRKPGTPCVERGCGLDSHKFEAGDWAFHRVRNVPFKVTAVDGAILRTEDGEWLHGKHYYHIPPPKEGMSSRKEAIAELARQEQVAGHYHCDPFTGPHWDSMKSKISELRQYMHGSESQQIAQCLCDLADELRRLREVK